MTTPSERTRPVRIGLVGYGAGGRRFHAPYIAAATGVELAGVVTRSPGRRAEVEADFPGVPVYDSLAALVEGERAGHGIDAVTITTPPTTRRELVLEALSLGVDVVADKPFAPTPATAVELRDAAAAAGRTLAVYHNRRWDPDVRTIRDLLDAGDLGTIRRFHSRYDLDEPGSLEGGPGGGLLRDLGSHLVDQALWLFGPATRVFARLDPADTPEGPTDEGFVITIEHADGTDSHLSASKRNRLQAREFRLYGADGSYTASTTDVQTVRVDAGERPADDPSEWAHEPEHAWGVLSTAAGARRVPSSRGSYVDYYEQFAAAVRGEADAPVSADDAVAVIEVLDVARRSDEIGAVVDLGGR